MADPAESQRKTPADPATGTRASVRKQESRSTDKYEMDQHTYPKDLLSNQTVYGGNYVIFFINTAVDGKLAETSQKNFVSASDVPKRETGQLAGSNYSKEGAVAASAFMGAIAGAAGAGAGLAGGAVGGIGAAVIPTSGTLTRPTKRLKTAVALYMPNQVGIRYGMQWEEESMNMFAAAMEGGKALGDALTGDVSKASGSIRNIAANLAISAGTPGSAAVARVGGVAANPRKEQVFRGVDYRSFQFNYQFFPKSSAEAEAVMEIIHTFKYHMHPEFKDDKGFLYVYPSEFDIVYYNGGQENNNIHKHTSCVLKEMNVNYTPQGQFNTFSDGTPMQINVDMTFLELALLTKESIDKGM